MPSVSTSIIWAPLSPKPCDRGLNQLSAFRRDLIGDGEIVEVAHLKAEVTVEGVDQDFESRLQGVEIELDVPVGCVACQFFGLEAKYAQIPQQAGKYAQLIFLWQVVVDQHDRGIQGRHIAVENAPGCSLVLDMRVTADNLAAFFGARY